VGDGDGDADEGARRSPLGRRDFALYWWGGMVSGPGTWLNNVTASVLMYTLTGSPFLVGVVNFAIFIPTLLFSLPAGAIGDRLDRRAVVVVSYAVSAVLAGVLALLAAQGRLGPVALVVMCFLLGSAMSFAKPALAALLPALVPREDLARATALNVMQFQFGQVAGPGLASVILLAGTPALAFGLNALSFLGPIAAMLLIRPAAASAGRPGGPPGGRGGVREGLRYVRRDRLMPAVLLTVVLGNAAVETLRTLAPTIAEDLRQPEVAGVVIMGYSVGALLGLLAFGRLERALAAPTLLVTAFLLQAFGLVGVALAPSLVLTVLAAAPIGLGFSVVTPMMSAALQRLAPEGMRGRVMATFSMAHLGFRPFFALAAGAAASAVGTGPALALFAVVAVLAGAHVLRARVGQEGAEG
jgi:MFS family permease